MSTEQNIEEVNVEQPQQEAPTQESAQQQSAEDLIERFDPTSKARRDAIESVERVLKQTGEGAKLDAKRTARALKGLLTVCVYQEQMIRGILGDLIRAGQMLMKHDTTELTLATQMRAIMIGLEREGFLSEAQLQEIAQNEVMPKAMNHLNEEAVKAAKEAGAEQDLAPEDVVQTEETPTAE